MITDWQVLLEGFSGFEISLMVINAILLLVSYPLFNKLSHGHMEAKKTRLRLNVFRSINALIIALLVFYHLLLPNAGVSWVIRIVGVLFVIYLTHLGFSITNYFILSRFGRRREVDGTSVVSDTYNTRALKILAAILFFVIALLGSLQVLELNSLLQAGGVIGFVGVLMALTQASWAPDIISGLIILNSGLFEEGDVVQLEGMDSDLIGMIFKTKMFHTEILNIVNNHRIMIRNAKLRDHAIHNLSKFASARGLREVLVFNIGYEHDADAVRQMFNEALNRVVEGRSDIDIDHQHPLEIRADSADNYAVKWKVFYFTKNLKRLLQTRQEFIEVILQCAREKGISLATPLLHQEAETVLPQGASSALHQDN